MIPRLIMLNAGRRASRGVHHPPIVRASDDHDYVLKLGDRDRDFPACELVAAMLATAFGVEIPPFALIEVPDDLRAVLALQGPAWADLAAPQPAGGCFGSRWIDVATPFTPLLTERIEDRDSFWRLFVFDVFIENGDRQPNNPNVLVQDRRLVAIDHGQALPCVQGLRDIGPFGHAAHVLWPVVAADPSRLAASARRLPDDRDIDDAVACVPAEWWADSGRPAMVRAALRARRQRTRDILDRLSTP